ncbi:meiotic recombination protein REC114-like [Asterias amurensis]|uniref:meiotic recombination protein REC114-like n=1 Tax=Asterias amurensis TaxID=7602 RepID=UPI003AB1E7FF
MAPNSNQSEWRLLRYARFIRSTSTVQTSVQQVGKEGEKQPEGTWKHQSWSDSEPLILSIQDSSHLLITRGKLILESHPLFDAEHYLKAAAKGDCVLFLQRIKNECRKFRVKFRQDSFSSTLEACADCLTVLRSFIKVQEEPVSPSQNATRDRQTLQGEVSLGLVAKVVTGSATFDLPAAYHFDQSSWTEDRLNDAIHLCLSDPTFPAFVESVEKQLKKIVTEG